ncbi:MAG: GNAT family N-acetyltransferase [Bacteroidetes bacterium HGW-Bacteroidetes-3]|nr:MAG: GNAT family N-acetyltransferase [Bacteroidetes bacterium HGW-Bacteroidetes-3]
MITYTTSKTTEDLSGIIALQKINLLENLTEIERQNHGFLSVTHSLEVLEKMQAEARNIIIKDKNEIVGYALAMTKKSKYDIPILIPMFETFDKIKYKGKLVSDYNYIVMGQVCIHKKYRGQGLFDGGYEAFKNYFKTDFDFAITEIATKNTRSRAAHKRVGFEEIHAYKDFNETEWRIVIWDWNTDKKS